MRPSEALALHRDEVLAIIARYPVTNPRIFGSVARGEDVEGSDVDILVEPDATTTFVDIVELQEALRAVRISFVHTASASCCARINADSTLAVRNTWRRRRLGCDSLQCTRNRNAV